MSLKMRRDFNPWLASLHKTCCLSAYRIAIIIIAIYAHTADETYTAKILSQIMQLARQQLTALSSVGLVLVDYIVGNNWYYIEMILRSIEIVVEYIIGNNWY
jgi:hypothetical protein